VLEGSLGVLSARLLVPDDEAARARRILSESGLAHELRPEAS
jgi:putative signal transducing protein